MLFWALVYTLEKFLTEQIIRAASDPITFIFLGWCNGQFMLRKYSGLSRTWNELLKFPSQRFVSMPSRVRFQSVEWSFKFSLLWGQAKCFPFIYEERVILARVHTGLALVLISALVESSVWQEMQLSTAVQVLLGSGPCKKQWAAEASKQFSSSSRETLCCNHTLSAGSVTQMPFLSTQSSRLYIWFWAVKNMNEGIRGKKALKSSPGCERRAKISI